MKSKKLRKTKKMIKDKYEALEIIYIDSLDGDTSERFKEAVDFLKGEGYPIDEELLRLKDEDENSKKASNAAKSLLEILQEFNIWRIGKYDKELKDIKDTLQEFDKGYIHRLFLFKDLMELPKYAEMDEDEKIVIAMKIGALDTSDLSYSQKNK